MEKVSTTAETITNITPTPPTYLLECSSTYSPRMFLHAPLPNNSKVYGIDLHYYCKAQMQQMKKMQQMQQRHTTPKTFRPSNLFSRQLDTLATNTLWHTNHSERGVLSRNNYHCQSTAASVLLAVCAQSVAATQQICRYWNQLDEKSWIFFSISIGVLCFLPIVLCKKRKRETKVSLITRKTKKGTRHQTSSTNTTYLPRSIAQFGCHGNFYLCGQTTLDALGSSVILLCYGSSSQIFRIVLRIPTTKCVACTSFLINFLALTSIASNVLVNFQNGQLLFHWIQGHHSFDAV